MFSKCNCGRDGRYIHLSKDGDEIMACNKYNVCKPYSELEQELSESKFRFKELLEAAVSVLDFKEGSTYYKDASKIIEKYVKGK